MYTRADPSPRYTELLTAYRTMHEKGEAQSGLSAEKTFAGFSLYQHMMTVQELAQNLGARTLLDYGSGKGMLHSMKPLKLPGGAFADSLASLWGIDRTVCYDPGFKPHAERPIGTFDLVICCDVLEHCPAEDLPWIMEDIAGHARRGVFLVIACYPAKKSLPSGENAHITVQPPSWWKPRIAAAMSVRAGLYWHAVFEEAQGDRKTARSKRGQTPAD